MKLPFWLIESVRLPGQVAVDAKVPCPECNKPAIHVQPRVNDENDKIRPAYAFRCADYHEWAFIGGKQILQMVNGVPQWESHE